MVIDDQAVVRQGFVSLINTVADMEVIVQGVNGQQALELYDFHQDKIAECDTQIETALIFFELEWAALDDERRRYYRLTAFGRRVQAIGSNRQAALFSGIRISRTRISSSSSRMPGIDELTGSPPVRVPPCEIGRKT